IADDVMNNAIDLAPAVEEGALVATLWGAEVEVDVAVADVTERYGANARHGACHSGSRDVEEFWNTCQRQRDVMLDRRAFALLGFRRTLAQTPEALCLGIAACESGVSDLSVFNRFAECGAQSLFEV